MQYRIIEFEQRNGNKFYRLQYRRLLFWRRWYKNERCIDGGYISYLVQFDTKAEAEQYARKFYEQREKRALQKIRARRIVDRV